MTDIRHSEENHDRDHHDSDLELRAVEIPSYRFTETGWVEHPVHVPNEVGIAVYVNRQEFVTIMCTPVKLSYLILGFLYGQGIISSPDDVLVLRRCEEEGVADVRLRNQGVELPTHRTLTSGCGGGAVFNTEGHRVESDFTVTPSDVLALMRQMQEQMDLYKHSGGVHTSALADNKSILAMAEDIGRHNTLDKIQGECLVRGLATKDRLILTTGRISSEMLLKVAKMQIPIVVSRHSPTAKSVALALELGITLVGHARGGRLQVYSYPERLGCLKTTAGTAAADRQTENQSEVR